MLGTSSSGCLLSFDWSLGCFLLSKACWPGSDFCFPDWRSRFVISRPSFVAEHKVAWRGLYGARDHFQETGRTWLHIKMTPRFDRFLGNVFFGKTQHLACPFLNLVTSYTRAVRGDFLLMLECKRRTASNAKMTAEPRVCKRVDSSDCILLQRPASLPSHLG